MRSLVLLTVLLAATTHLCLALAGLAPVSPARAKEMGLEIRSMPAGPDAVRVELEFATEGELKEFGRVDLEFGEGDKYLVTSSLREEAPKPGRVMVSFAADRAQLDKLTLRLVAGRVYFRTVYVLRVKEFVDLTKLR